MCTTIDFTLSGSTERLAGKSDVVVRPVNHSARGRWGTIGIRDGWSVEHARIAKIANAQPPLPIANSCCNPGMRRIRSLDVGRLCRAARVLLGSDLVLWARQASRSALGKRVSVKPGSFSYCTLLPCAPVDLLCPSKNSSSAALAGTGSREVHCPDMVSDANVWRILWSEAS